MKTLELSNTDLKISNHNFVVLDDRNTLKQRIQNRLSLFLGEYSLEPNLGIDWLSFMTLRPDVEAIKKAVRSELLSDTEITGINSLEIIVIDTPEKEVQYNKPRRTSIIEYSVNTIYGVITNG